MGCVVEEWRDIPGQEGRYQVSNLGRVRSVSRRVPCGFGHTKGVKGRVLKPRVSNKSGHVAVGFYHRGPKAWVHRLVADVFLGPCPEGLEVRHLNGDPADNRVDNLEYGTRQQNVRDIAAHGGRALQPETVRAIRSRLSQGHQQAHVARQLGVTPCVVHRIAHGSAYVGVV